MNFVIIPPHKGTRITMNTPILMPFKGNYREKFRKIAEGIYYETDVVWKSTEDACIAVAMETMYRANIEFNCLYYKVIKDYIKKGGAQ